MAAYEKWPSKYKFGIGIPAYFATFYLSLAAIDLLAILLFILAYVSLAAFLSGVFNKSKKDIYRGLLFCAYFGSIIYGSGKVIEIDTSVGKIKGENVAMTVEHYKKKNGSYPKSIEGLSGNDGSFKIGFEKRKIRYWVRKDESSFCVSFYIQVMLTADYCSDTKEWIIDD